MNSTLHNLTTILDKVQLVELRALQALDSTRIGNFQSVFRGQGMEFDQVREYVPGDDVRHIDWNATARAGRPFVQVHVEVRDLTVLLTLDVSPSADFGTIGSTKREQMAELAAVLAFAALRGNDRVGLILFSDSVEAFIPPGAGRTHVLQIVRAVLTHRSEGTSTSLTAPLQHIQKMFRQRAAVFLISDFFHEEDVESVDRELAILALQHELIAVRCTDPIEARLTDVGWLTLRDAETGEVVEIDTSDPSVRRAYSERSQALSASLAQRLRSSGVDLLEVSTERDYAPQLAAFLKSRGRSVR